MLRLLLRQFAEKVGLETFLLTILDSVMDALLVSYFTVVSS